MCPMNCHPTYCGMKVSKDDQNQITITSNPDHPESKGFLCQRGRNVHEINDHPSRLLVPQRRNNRSSEWIHTTWETVFGLLADKFKQPERIAVWMGHGAVVSDLNRPLLFHFAHTLGIRVWNPAVVCWAAGAYGLAATGIVETNTKEDVAANSDFILLWGWNPVSQPTTAPFIVEAKKRGAKVIAIDCRLSEAKQIADQMIMINPDSDAALALAMCHVMIRDGYINREFIEKNTIGFEEFTASVQSFTPEWASTITGVSANDIAELARQYALSPASVILMGASSMFKGQNGWYASRAIACLPALTGQVGKPGTGFGPRHRGFVKALDYAAITPHIPPKNEVSSHMEEIIKTLESGEIDTLFLFGTNLLSSFADAKRVEAALVNVHCIIAHDIVINQTMKKVADIVLPGTTWIEELGIKSTDTYVYLMDQIREPTGEARSISFILSDLASRLDQPDAAPFQTQEEAINMLLKGLGSDITVTTLRENGGQWSRKAEPVGHSNLVFHTPSKKIEFVSDLLTTLGLPSLPIPQFDSNDTMKEKEPYPLILRTGRSGTAFHSFYDEGRMLSKVHQREPIAVVWVNTHDANARGIDDGVDVEIYNQKSVFPAKAYVSEAVVKGVLWMRDGWFGINHLTEEKSPIPPHASEGLLPIQMPGGRKQIPGGQSSYIAMVNVRPISGVKSVK